MEYYHHYFGTSKPLFVLFVCKVCPVTHRRFPPNSGQRIPQRSYSGAKLGTLQVTQVTRLLGPRMGLIVDMQYVLD
jgi:hypothetical protein